MKNATLGAVFGAIGVIVLIICCCCSICFLPFIFSNGSSATLNTRQTEYVTAAGDTTSENEILSIPVDGIINTESAGDTVSILSTAETFGYSVKDELLEAAEDENIKGVILEINSPGGTVTGSAAISDGIAAYKEKTNKPVVAYIKGLAASGGYWAAAGADYIIADQGSTIGSIGVIFGPFEYYDKVIEQGSLFGGTVVTQNGIETYYITAGQYKDLGNPYRRLSETERRVIQESVNNDYTDFVNFVAESRGITADKIRNQIGALIYGNKQAQDLGLIDASGNRDEAYAEIAKQAGVESDYKIVTRSKTSSFFAEILGAVSRIGTPQAQQSEMCSLCYKNLYLHGNPLEYGVR